MARVAYRIARATFSNCGTYRYLLERTWGIKGPHVLLIGLNPSTATADEDDPTVRRCVSFAQDAGAAGLWLVNLFALRSSTPRALLATSDPVGPENDKQLDALLPRAARVIVAWGNAGRFQGRADRVMAKLSGAYCFGRTRQGAPRHPLYLPRTSRLQAY